MKMLRIVLPQRDKNQKTGKEGGQAPKEGKRAKHLKGFLVLGPAGVIRQERGADERIKRRSSNSASSGLLRNKRTSTKAATAPKTR